MKKALIFVVGLILLVSCSSNDEQESIDNEVVGKWQVFERVDDIIDPENPYDAMGIWEPIENGRIVEFNSDGEFLGLINICNNGTFSTNEGKLNIYCDEYGLSEFLYEIDANGSLIISTGFVSEKFYKI